MDMMIQKEGIADLNRTKNLQGNRINVTCFVNHPDPKNVKKRILDLLATGKGKLEITNQMVFLSISNLLDREKFYADLQ